MFINRNRTFWSRNNFWGRILTFERLLMNNEFEKNVFYFIYNDFKSFKICSPNALDPPLL